MKICRGLLAIFALVLLATAAKAEKVELRSGTPVIIQLIDGVSSKTARTGDMVNAIVLADIIVDDKVVVQAGATALVNVAQANKAGAIGKAGGLNLQVNGVYAVDGQLVPVTGGKSMAAEDEVTGTVVVGVLLCPLALLNEGDSAEIGSNVQFRVVTISNVKVDVE